MSTAARQWCSFPKASWNGALGVRKPVVPILVGPTAVGKTAVLLELARHWDVVAVSADSRQIYRGLDIGTAKPSADEQAVVPHLGIDLVEPSERYSAGRFAADAVGWLAALPQGTMPVVVGGTGFYIRALVDGLFKEPPMDLGRRERLQQWSASAEGLGRWATRLDSGYSGGGRQRAARSVEVALLTGRPLSWWQRQAKMEAVLEPWYVHLTLPRAVLYRRIAARTGDMLRRGLVDEVECLLAGGLKPEAPGLNAVGYREVVRYLRGGLPADELEAAIVTSTRRYAKRQETWFRNQLAMHEVVVLDASAGAETVAERVRDSWSERGA
jgi:tRNA dimethylallyltransferase